MKPEQANALRVALDRLKEWEVSPDDVVCAMYDAPTAKAMLAGTATRDALCLLALEFGRDMDIDEPREVFNFVGQALVAAHGEHVYDSQEHGQMVRAQITHAGEMHTDHCWARLAWGDGVCECIALALPETPAGVHAPQPQTPPTETGCVKCGKPIPSDWMRCDGCW